MSVLSDYQDTLTLLVEKRNKFLSLPFCKRDVLLIEVIEDEIKDCEFAIDGILRSGRDRYVYISRSDILPKGDY